MKNILGFPANVGQSLALNWVLDKKIIKNYKISSSRDTKQTGHQQTV
jgi:hypothetical protein